jgi:hypothetical protein
VGVQVPEDFVQIFAALDRARLTRMSEPARGDQLAARQVLLDYLEALWQDVRRAGERPDVGDKYEALAAVRELSRSMTAVAFEAVYDQPAPEPEA